MFDYFKNKLTFCLKGLVISMLFFGGLNYVEAASVNVGDDINLINPVINDLDLSGTTTGFELCDFVDYMWTEESNTIFIEMPYEKDMAKIYANDMNDHPGIYNIKLTATCNGGDPAYGGFIEEDTFILTISAPSSNQAPTDIVIDNDNIDENNSSGAIIGNFSTIDPDDPSQVDTYKYFLVSGTGSDDNANFHIEDRILHIDTQTDYETKSSYKIRAQTQDSSYAFYEKEFIININDVDETVPSVNAGEDQNVVISNTVILNGTKSGFPASGCNFNYKWTSDNDNVIINNSGSLTGANFETNSFTGTTVINIGLIMNVSSTEIVMDSCGKTGTYNDNTVITLSKNRHSGMSSYMRRKLEADRLFKDEESIKNIKLILTEKKGSRYNYNIGWNYIGGGGHIEYEVLYSTGSTFKNYKEYTTKMSSKSFYYKELDENKDIYFFKVRAKYNNKESPWSNTLSITNKNNLLKYFKVTCKNCNNNVSFGDVFKTPDILIEENLRIQCITCKKKVSYKDIFESTSYILDNFNIGCNSCNKKIDYGNIFKQSYFNVKCKSCNVNKSKVNFDELVK